MARRLNLLCHYRSRLDGSGTKHRDEDMMKCGTWNGNLYIFGHLLSIYPHACMTRRNIVTREHLGKNWNRFGSGFAHN
jgi:hypothetical protein